MFLLEIELAPLSVVWGFLLTTGIVGMVLSLIRWWLGVPTLLLLLLFSLLFSVDLYDDLYGKIVKQEPNYIPLLNLAIASGFLFNFLGVGIYLVRRRARTK